MYVLLIIIISHILGFSSEKQKLHNYIKRYDIVDCYVSGFRTKRNLNMKEEKTSSAFDAEVRFKLNQTVFHLLLIEDIAFKKLKVQSYLLDNSTDVERIDIKMFEGIVKDESLSSFVIGYLHDSVFTGTIKFNETVYYVEPASRFFSSLTSMNKIIVYRDDDVVHSESFNRFESSPALLGVKFPQLFLNGEDGNVFLSKGIEKTTNDNEDYACVIELVADHTLYNHFNGNTNDLTAYLYIHGKYSDIIFRRTDFDGDGKRDRIRIIPGKIFIYKTKDDPDYPMNIDTDMTELLNLFSLRTQNYCLAVCMTYRHSTDSIIGVAFRSHASSIGPVGGICQKPFRASIFSNVKKSLNTALLTVRGRSGSRLPLAMSILAVTHEIGHSFGSDHDSMEDFRCSPGGDKGFYLMHPRSQGQIKPLSSFFSPCSKKSIADVILARGECLRPHNATCGNGVQEGDEDCDCGKEVICKDIDRCCTPSDVNPPEIGCTFRNSTGAVCSARENKCCTRDCSVNKDTQFLCYNDTTMCRISYCDGINAICPETKAAPDKYPCHGTSKSCLGGYCNSSVCLDNNLTDCVCLDVFSECHVCCEKDNLCATASSLGFFPPTGGHYFAFEGTSCNFDTYQCDGSGGCSNPHSRSKNVRKSVLFWWVIGSLVFALIVVVFVLIYFIKVYSVQTNTVH